VLKGRDHSEDLGVDEKVKVKLSLSLTKHHAMKSLTSVLDGGEWSASRPGRFIRKERPPDTHWIGGCVDPRAGLDTVSKRKILSPHRDSSPDQDIIKTDVREIGWEGVKDRKFRH
jgi:hypothetical protein